MKKFRIIFTLILLASLLAALLGLVRVPPAHAQSTITVSTCDESHLDAAITQANSDNTGDTITFSCSGDILLTSTLNISGSMNLDGNGQSVTLDGQNTIQVLVVNSGVTFTLNALTVAHGLGASNVFGICCSGGGLFNSGTVNITNSTFANNSASGGGGGLFNSGTVSISNSAFTNNPANEGGGLYNEGMVNITNSTFANDSASLAAGGLFNTNTGTVSISNSTFANDSASGGGGLLNFGTVNISNSTFVYNSSGSSGGGLINNGPMSIGGSIVANNSAPGGGNCAAGRGGVTSDQGYNLESGTDCGFTASTDQQNTDPRLNPNGLRNNGGPTQTIALEPDSPAIDRIPKSSCPPTDQRGISRPQGPTSCDIGAFELKATEGITELIAIVKSFGLSSGLQTSLDAKLADALSAINAGQTATACSDLTDFINQVKAKANKGISPSQAQQLIKAATNLQGVLGC